MQYWLGLGYNSTKCYIFWVNEGYIQSQCYLAMAFCWQTPHPGIFSDAEKRIEPIMSNTMQLFTEIFGWKSKMFCEILIQHGIWCMKYPTLLLIQNMDQSYQCIHKQILWYPNTSRYRSLKRSMNWMMKSHDFGDYLCPLRQHCDCSLWWLSFSFSFIHGSVWKYCNISKKKEYIQKSDPLLSYSWQLEHIFKYILVSLKHGKKTLDDFIERLTKFSFSNFLFFP